MVAPEESEGIARVCETEDCRVLLYQDSTTGEWVHPPELQEKFSHHVCSHPRPGREAHRSELKFGRGKSFEREKMALYPELSEYAPAGPGATVTVAIAGSFKVELGEGNMRKPMSWAYLTDGGYYGFGTSKLPGSLVGGDRTLQAELRAIWWALTRVPRTHPLVLTTHSLDAVDLVDDWREGLLTMPYGYEIKRASDRESTLVQLAKLLRDDQGRIEIDWVPNYVGRPLNDGARALARLARDWAVGRKDQEWAQGRGRHIARSSIERGKAAVYCDIPGFEPVSSQEPLMVATSYWRGREMPTAPGNRRSLTWAYLSSGGYYAFGILKLDAEIVGCGENQVLLGELRAAWMALTRIPREHTLRITTHSPRVVELIDDWRAGLATMPAAYRADLDGGREATLVQMAKFVEENRDAVDVSWTPEDVSTPLTDGARRLAQIAAEWALGRDSEESIRMRCHQVAIDSTEQTAMRYVGAAHPERTAKIPHRSTDSRFPVGYA